MLELDRWKAAHSLQDRCEGGRQLAVYPSARRAPNVSVADILTRHMQVLADRQ